MIFCCLKLVNTAPIIFITHFHSEDHLSFFHFVAMKQFGIEQLCERVIVNFNNLMIAHKESGGGNILDIIFHYYKPLTTQSHS